MKPLLLLLTAIALTNTAMTAQPIKWPASFEKLAQKATEVADVTLDGSTLKLASKFLSGDEPDQAKLKTTVSRIEGIYVKSFEFENSGEYSQADIEEIRSQIKPTDWKRIVNVTSKKDGENVEIFVREKDGKSQGFFILAAEPKELTIVQILGSLTLDDLAGLEGEMGIPSVGIRNKAKLPAPTQPPKKEED